MSQRAFRLLEHHLEGTRVDLAEHVAFLHEIAFLKVNLHQLAVDTRLHSDRVESCDVPEAIEIDRNWRALRFRANYWQGSEIPPASSTTEPTAGTAASLWLGSNDKARLVNAPDCEPGHPDNYQKKKDPD